MLADLIRKDFATITRNVEQPFLQLGVLPEKHSSKSSGAKIPVSFGCLVRHSVVILASTDVAAELERTLPRVSS